MQTGVQLLTGFLLTLPFQSSFESLDSAHQSLYLATVSACLTATVCLQAPVSLHRGLFHRHQRDITVRFAHHLAMAGIGLLGCAVVGVAALIFSVVVGTVTAVIASAVVAVLLIVTWLGLPIFLRGEKDD